jgi:hypothetical protein
MPSLRYARQVPDPKASMLRHEGTMRTTRLDTTSRNRIERTAGTITRSDQRARAAGHLGVHCRRLHQKTSGLCESGAVRNTPWCALTMCPQNRGTSNLSTVTTRCSVHGLGAGTASLAFSGSTAAGTPDQVSPAGTCVWAFT